MDALHLELLGAPQITRGGSPIAGFVSAKAPALLIYLAVTARPHTRAALAGLLWGELPEPDARMNLRNAIANLRRLVGPHLIITRETLAFDRSAPYWLDVELFQANLQPPDPDLGRLRAAAALYKGDLLEGFYVRDAPAFEEWLLAERERLRQLALHALHALAARLTERGEYAAALDVATQLLARDPLREEAHRQVMWLLARSGRRDAALVQYDTCRHILDQELGVEPDAETTALYEQIKAGAIAAQPLLTARRDNLPVPATPLLGRAAELAQIVSLLAQPACRLLTLVGPGGVGKTRLALEVAAKQLSNFDDGAYFVELAPIRDPALVATTIAQVLELREADDQPVASVLKAWLRERELLLLLDNFEQILDAAPLVGELLASCPRLKLLVTSRAPLRIRGEQELPVAPLALPDLAHLPDPQALSRYAAVELFIQRAVSVQPDFRVTSENAPALAAICSRLEGLPLAIELAAARIKLLSPQGILDRLGSRLALLTWGPRDLPARQQTMRHTIAWSYDLLSAEERRLFRRLAIFAGGCTLEAAETVCNVSGDSAPAVLDGMAALVEQSLLRQDERAEGQPYFTMLETIREYGLEQLVTSGELADVQRRYTSYYVAMAETAEPELRGPHQVAWLDRLEREHDNLRAALARCLATAGQAELGLRLAARLGWFWYLHGHLSEGRRWLQQALAQTEHWEHSALRAQAVWIAGALA
jgi:predicted ATPase/DNA-binding SARP family transcriptional activator